MTSERRKNRRLDVLGDYYYYPGNNKTKLECKLKNISATGACVTSEQEISKYDIIFLHIRGTNNIEIKSKVVWRIKNQYGLMFLLDNNSEFEKISYIMNNVVGTNQNNPIIC